MVDCCLSLLFLDLFPFFSLQTPQFRDSCESISVAFPFKIESRSVRLTGSRSKALTGKSKSETFQLWLCFLHFRFLTPQSDFVGTFPSFVLKKACQKSTRVKGFLTFCVGEEDVLVDCMLLFVCFLISFIFFTFNPPKRFRVDFSFFREKESVSTVGSCDFSFFCLFQPPEQISCGLVLISCWFRLGFLADCTPISVSLHSGTLCSNSRFRNSMFEPWVRELYYYRNGTCAAR